MSRWRMGSVAAFVITTAVIAFILKDVGASRKSASTISSSSPKQRQRKLLEDPLADDLGSTELEDYEDIVANQEDEEDHSKDPLTLCPPPELSSARYVQICSKCWKHLCRFHYL